MLDKRWGVIDPHSFKYMSATPYNYAFNSPTRIVDPTGMDGVLYIQVLTNKKGKPSMNKKDIEGAVAKLNSTFKKMGVELKIEVHYGNKILSKKDFYAREGDKNSAKGSTKDSYMILGSNSQLKEVAQSAKDGGWDKAVTDRGGYSGISGVSSRSQYFAMLNTDNIKVNGIGAKGAMENFDNPMEKLVTTIMHESGHPKFMNLPGADSNGHSSGIMSSQPHQDSEHVIK